MITIRSWLKNSKDLGVLLLLAALSIAPGQGQAVEQATQDPNKWRADLVNNANAPVKVIEFFDYQCPFCAAAIPAIEEALRSHPGKVQLILRNMPLSIHPDSMLAHQAAIAAAEQGKFWEMHALLFENQRKLRLENLIEYARQLNLDGTQFRQRLESGYFRTAIKLILSERSLFVFSATLRTDSSKIAGSS